jgi:DNA ligase (NAD+)
MSRFFSKPRKNAHRISKAWKSHRTEEPMLRKALLFLMVVQGTCFAAPRAAQQQAGALQAILRQADEAYYNRHQSVMSDAAYDALRARYQQLLADYPELATEPSVGASPDDAGRQVAHEAPVLSLEKARSDEEVSRFIEKSGAESLYCVEPKVDGLTVVLRYRNGLLAQALTRGDGKTGIDITPAVLASGAVPAILTNAPARFDVRGEALLPLPAFEKLNRRRSEAGLELLKNPRNIASGTLMLTDYAEIAARTLEIHCFELLAADPMPATHTAALAQMRQAGLNVIASRTVSSSEVLAEVARLNRQRAEFPFLTDGVVIKLDDLARAAQLGSTAHHPRSAIARKYEETPVQTRLLAVEWTRGASGRLTPVALFEPVEIQGATVQRATLFNVEHLRALDLRLGDWINVIRSGGTVPEITGVCVERRTGQETAIPDPEE